MQSSFARVCALVLGCWSLTAAADPATPDFARDLQPIFKPTVPGGESGETTAAVNRSR
jgi:hypothetical protein